MKKKKSIRYQNGATFNYEKTGNTDISKQQLSSLTSGANSAGLQFTPEFSSAYFSQDVAPVQTSPPDYSKMPIVDITSNGMFTPRKVWRTQRPEWFVGKQIPVEGKDYTTVSYHDWKNTYQTSPEYLKYAGQEMPNNSVASYQFGGGFQTPLPETPNWYAQQSNPYAGYPQTGVLGNAPYQPVDYSQNFAQNNPLPQQFQTNPEAGFQKQVIQDFNTMKGYDPTMGYTDYVQGDANLSGTVNEEDTVDKFGNPLQTSTNTAEGKTKFFNPWGGFDIPSAAYKLGQGIESGNAFDITTGGLKLATGLGRNIAAGMGYQNRRENILQDFQEKARAASRPIEQSMQYGGYFQDGGQQMGQQAPPQDQGQAIMQQVAEALQSGADPQQVLQQLVSSGIPQEEATALIQGVMQQLQQAPQEQAQQAMRDGGTSKKKVEGHPDYLQEGGLSNGEFVAEIEDGEIVKTPDGQIKEAVGEKHQDGGIKLTEEQLPDGSQIISDHLEVGKSGAKKFNDDYDLGIKSTDTYATVIDKFNRKSGIKKINDEQEIVLKNIEKQAKKLEDNPAASGTIKLNLQLYTEQLKELQDQKDPLVEARRVLFDEVFKPQEESKVTGHNVEEAQKPIPSEQEQPTAQNGGIFNGDMILGYAQKYNLHPDKVVEIMQHANGGIQKYQNAGVSQNPYLQNSTLITDFPKIPKELAGLPYTPRETNPNEIWQGVNYENTWIPLVEASLANPEQAKKIDTWLTENKGTFSPNVQKQLEGLTGEARIQKIKTLATDKFPGLFHNAVLSAIEATAPPAQAPIEAVITPTGYVPSTAAGQTKYVLPNLPDQSPLLPDSLQGALKTTHRYDRVETPLASPDLAVAEIRRQEQSAIQGVQGLPDAQRASAIAQIQANTQNAINQAVAGTTGSNQQAKFNTDVANAQIQAREEDMRNKDLTDYEAKILKADAITQANLRNYYNAAQKVNLGNFNYVQGLNLINDRYNNAQFTGDGVENVNLQKAAAYDNIIAKSAEQRLADIKTEIAAKKKAETKAKKRFGGRK